MCWFRCIRKASAADSVVAIDAGTHFLAHNFNITSVRTIFRRNGFYLEVRTVLLQRVSNRIDHFSFRLPISDRRASTAAPLGIDGALLLGTVVARLEAYALSDV